MNWGRLVASTEKNGPSLSMVHSHISHLLYCHVVLLFNHYEECFLLLAAMCFLSATNSHGCVNFVVVMKGLETAELAVFFDASNSATSPLGHAGSHHNLLLSIISWLVL